MAILDKIFSSKTRAAIFREVSADWRFGIVYNAALKLCTIRNSCNNIKKTIPEKPGITIDTNGKSVEECLNNVMRELNGWMES